MTEATFPDLCSRCGRKAGEYRRSNGKTGEIEIHLSNAAGGAWVCLYCHLDAVREEDLACLYREDEDEKRDARGLERASGDAKPSKAAGTGAKRKVVRSLAR